MKKLLLTSLIIAGIYANIFAQDLLAKWTFPTGTVADSVPDGGLSINSSMGLSTGGGTSVIDFNKNGLTTKAAQATEWDDGEDLKCWKINLCTEDYENIKLSSKITAGGNNPGPRDFKVQYKIDTGTWIDISGSSFTTANDWTTGVLSNLNLPVECNNQPLITIRWIMTSNTSVTGVDVLTTGTSKIDDIYIYGTSTTAIKEAINEQFEVKYNSSTKTIEINSDLEQFITEVYSLTGIKVFTSEFNSSNTKINTSLYQTGVYIIRTETKNDIIVKKINIINN